MVAASRAEATRPSTRPTATPCPLRRTPKRRLKNSCHTTPTQVEGLDVGAHAKVADDHGGERGGGAEQGAVGDCAWGRQGGGERGKRGGLLRRGLSVQQQRTPQRRQPTAQQAPATSRPLPPSAPSTSIWRGLSPVLSSRSWTALNMTSSASSRAHRMSNWGGSRCRPVEGWGVVGWEGRWAVQGEEGGSRARSATRTVPMRRPLLAAAGGPAPPPCAPHPAGRRFPPTGPTCAGCAPGTPWTRRRRTGGGGGTKGKGGGESGAWRAARRDRGRVAGSGASRRLACGNPCPLSGPPPATAPCHRPLSRTHPRLAAAGDEAVVGHLVAVLWREGVGGSRGSGAWSSVRKGRLAGRVPLRAEQRLQQRRCLAQTKTAAGADARLAAHPAGGMQHSSIIISGTPAAAGAHRGGSTQSRAGRWAGGGATPAARPGPRPPPPPRPPRPGRGPP